jgi:hypothetical protein
MYDIARWREVVLGGSKRYIWITMAIFAYILLYPYFVGGNLDLAVFTTLISVILITATLSMVDDRRYALLAIVLLVPGLLVQWYSLFHYYESAIIVARLFWIILLTLVVVVLLRDIIGAKRPIPRKVLWSAVSVYLIIGLIWALFYSIIEFIDPGSFIYTGMPTELLVDSELIYYSFVTVTTLGYGDIVPATIHAKSFVIVEMVTGVLYLAILISSFLKKVE